MGRALCASQPGSKPGRCGLAPLLRFPHDGSMEADEKLLMVPTTRYARSGEATIAYQVAGQGPLDLLFLPGWISQIEQLWDTPAVRRFLERLAVFNRLILFDRRGSGLSDSAGDRTPSSRRRSMRSRSRCRRQRSGRAADLRVGRTGRCTARGGPSRADRCTDHVRVDRPYIMGSRL